MKLEHQVTSLEISKRLKELGVKQESLFWWVKGQMEYGYEGEWNISEAENYFLFDHRVGHTFDDHNFQVYPDEEKFGAVGVLSDEEWIKWEKEQKRLIKKMKSTICSAFTVAELGEMLPRAFTYKGKVCILKMTPERQFKIANDKKHTQTLYPDLKGHWVGYFYKDEGGEMMDCYHDTEADARGKMLIYLLENKLITL